MGHWIVILIYLHDGRAVIFNALWKMNKLRWVQGFQKLSAIVSEDIFFYAHKVHMKFVVDTSGWHTTLIGNTIEDPKCYDRRSEKRKQKYGTKLSMRWEFLVCMKNHMCYYTVHALYAS